MLVGRVKTAEEMLKDFFYYGSHNGNFVEIHSDNIKEMEEIMQEYAKQFIDIVEENVPKSRVNLLNLIRQLIK